MVPAGFHPTRFGVWVCLQVKWRISSKSRRFTTIKPSNRESAFLHPSWGGRGGCSVQPMYAFGRSSTPYRARHPAVAVCPRRISKPYGSCRRPKQCFAHNLGPRSPLDKFLPPIEPHERGGVEDGGPEVKIQQQIH